MDARIKSGHDELKREGRHVVISATRPAHAMLAAHPPLTAHAQSGPIGFQSPSKNIACQYFDYDKQNTLRCDISAMETKPRGPPIANSTTAAPSR